MLKIAALEIQKQVKWSSYLFQGFLVAIIYCFCNGEVRIHKDKHAKTAV